MLMCRRPVLYNAGFNLKSFSSISEFHAENSEVSSLAQAMHCQSPWIDYDMFDNHKTCTIYFSWRIFHVIFFIDDRIAVSATSIPMHLEQMIEILEQEEQEHGATVSLFPLIRML